MAALAGLPAALGSSRKKVCLTRAVAIPKAVRYNRTAVIIGVQLIAMTALAVILGTWQDEEYTLATTAHGAVYALHRAISYELQAPLYFVLVALLRDIAPSLVAARMFSVACALGVTATSTAIARRLWPDIDPWPLAAFVAFNPFVVFAAVEIRLYALAILVSGLLWLTFYDGFFCGQRRGARIAFVILAVAALYLEYFLAFELVGFAVALLIAGRFRALRTYVIAGMICAIGFLPMLAVLHSQIHAAFAAPGSRPLPVYSVFVHPLVEFLVPYEYGKNTALRAVNAALVLLALSAVAIGRPHLHKPALALGAIVVTIQVIYIVLVDVFNDPLEVPRHFVALFVPETAFAYAVLAALGNSARGVAARRAIAGIVALATILSLTTKYHALAKFGDWPRVGAWLERHARSGDTIAIIVPDAVPAFERYYHGPARVAAFPRPMDPNVYSIERMMVHSKAEALRAFAALPQSGRLWFVTFDGCDRLDRLGCLEVAAAQRERYRIVESHAFYSTTVERLMLRAALPRRRAVGRSERRGSRTSRGPMPVMRTK